MMITLSTDGEKYISGSYDGKPFSIGFDVSKYNQMEELRRKSEQVATMAELKAIFEEFEPLVKEDYKEQVETATPYIVVARSTGRYYLRFNDKVSSQPLPQVFVDKILKIVEKGLGVDPLIKCWARYMRPVKGRPAYSLSQATMFATYISAVYTDDVQVGKLMYEEGLSAEQARIRATRPQVSITTEGLLVCYKVSREVKVRFELDENENKVTRSRYGKTIDPDTGLITENSPEYVEDRLFKPYVMGDSGDEFFCGDVKGHFIRVGKTHKLENWDQVSSPGHKGLHCGGLNFIKGFQEGQDAVTHNIFVDPMHIHTVNSVAREGNDGAMTVKQYFVESSFAGPNREIYHPSKYAALTDAEYAEIVKEAVLATEAKGKELQDILEQTQALQTEESRTVSKLFIQE